MKVAGCVRETDFFACCFFSWHICVYQCFHFNLYICVSASTRPWVRTEGRITWWVATDYHSFHLPFYPFVYSNNLFYFSLVLFLACSQKIPRWGRDFWFMPFSHFCLFKHPLSVVYFFTSHFNFSTFRPCRQSGCSDSEGSEVRANRKSGSLVF